MEGQELFMIKFFLSFFLSVTIAYASSGDNDFSMDLQNVTLSEALHFIAKFMHKNVVINPSVEGVVSLHLHHVSAEKTFNMLLTSHDLMKVSLGNAWLIVPRK